MDIDMREHMRQQDETPTRDAAFYLRIFLGLTLATVVEVLAVYLVPFRWLRALILLSMAMAQTLLLIMNFMHLRWDRLLYSFLFFSGFIGAVLLVLALVALV